LADYHSELEFQFIQHGHGKYFIRDTNHAFERNHVLVIHRNQVHNYIPDPTSSVKKLTLILGTRALNGRPIAQGALKSLKSTNHLVLSDRSATNVKLMLTEIAYECANRGSHWQEAAIDFVELFLIILRRTAEGEVVPHQNEDPLMQEIIGFLDGKFSEQTLLRTVSHHFGLSPFALSRRFKQYVGLGFKEYLIHRRIAEAIKLLEETDMKVAAVAYHVGFDNLSPFNTNFRRLTGVTPSDYRKMMLANRSTEDHG
jgi:AraC-like DNA-binding protein